MYGEENIISGSDPRGRDNAPSSRDFVPLTKGIHRRDVIGDKKKCRDAREISLKHVRKGACAKFASFGSRRKHNLGGLDQKLYEKIPASIKERVKTSYVTVKTTSKTKKLS